MKKLLIFVLIIATIIGVFVMPSGASASEVNTGGEDVVYVGDTLVSEKIETDYDWYKAFLVFSDLKDVYYGVKEMDDLNVRVTFNIAGTIAVGEYEDGVFHDVYSSDLVESNDVLEYRDVYFGDGGTLTGYQYGDGKAVTIREEDLFKPLIIEIIDERNLTDYAKAWRRTQFEYSQEGRGYVREGCPTIRFKNGKVANLMYTLTTENGIFLCEINFEYGDSIIALPSALTFLRPQDKLAEKIDSMFGGLDYTAAKIMNKIATSFAGGIATFLMDTISLLTEKGLIFFIVAIIMMAFIKTRRAGIIMFVAIAVGAVFTNFVLKDAVMRSRPFETNTIYYEFWKAVGSPAESGFSFPSGHVTAAMAAATAFFICFKKKYSWLGFLVVLAVGASRIYLMAHYASDVLAAIIIGAISAILAIYITKLIYFILEHYRDHKVCSTILEKDFAEYLKKKREARAEKLKVAEAKKATETQNTVVTKERAKVETVIEEVEKVVSEKGTQCDPKLMETLVALMAEVKELIKDVKAEPKEVGKTENE